MSFFFFFSYIKSENRRVEQVLCGGGWYQREGERGVEMVKEG
jgi:hypothetical protein